MCNTNPKTFFDILDFVPLVTKNRDFCAKEEGHIAAPLPLINQSVTALTWRPLQI